MKNATAETDFLSSITNPEPTPEAVERMKSWLQYWGRMEAEVGAEFLESLSDEEFETLRVESRRQFGISEDEALEALLTVIEPEVVVGRREVH